MITLNTFSNEYQVNVSCFLLHQGGNMYHRFNQWVDDHIYHPGDDDEVLLVKKIWWVCLTFAIPMTLVLALTMFWMGYRELAMIFALSSLYWLLLMILFNRTKSGIEWYGLGSQSFLVLFSFALAWMMGGVLDSGGIIFLGLIGPVYALVFPRRDRAVYLFLLYLAAMFLLVLLDHIIRPVFPISQQDNLILFVISFAISALFWFAALYFFAYQRTKALTGLQEEEIKSTNLLLNILPDSVVEKLKTQPEVIADELQNVTILFADLVNFTEMVSRMKAEDVVTFLNRIFSDFDQFTEKHGLEKIKTIGDCYMAACGAPISRPEHAQSAVRMALDIQEYARMHDLQFHIGIHSGPVVAGVIGLKKFSYDLWGDTVNLASRLEGEAPPGSIFISEATREIVKDEFECRLVGFKELKGLGVVRIFEVLNPPTV